MTANIIKWHKGAGMASRKSRVNLDALIPREDLESKKPAGQSGGIPITELEVGKYYYGMLRKPYFQRETDDWDVDNVVSLVKSFLDGHLIPTVILWSAEGYSFVIDGAHRLSALIAWVNDDYGDGDISKSYFNGEIPRQQQKVADQCRDRIRKEVGTFGGIKKLSSLSNRTSDQLKKSTNFGKSIEAQWVAGDANMAATSFLAINQRAVEIDRTERHMIEHRGEPNVIAARAIVKSARGHAYWGSFEPVHVETIEQKARQIFSAIFVPENAEPHTDIDLQPAGQAHTANGLRLTLDLVNLINEVKLNAELKSDSSGDNTARFITKTHGVVKHIAGRDKASLSLHPAVYFWGTTGNHRPTVFLAMVSLVQEMLQREELINFTLHRAQFEEFLVSKSEIVKTLLKRHGGWQKSVTPVKNMFRAIFEGLKRGDAVDTIEGELVAMQSKTVQSDLEMFFEKSTWRSTKAALRIKTSLNNAPRCSICKARLVIADASDDHIVRREDGGKSSVDNAQLTHMFCNHGFKEHYSARNLSIPEISF